VKKRRELLLKVWKDIPVAHRPDFQLRCANYLLVVFPGLRFPVKATSYSKSPFCGPSLNLKDLTKKENLLHFISSRSRNPLSVFAHSDLHASELGIRLGMIVPAILEDHTMCLESFAPEEYGKIIAWKTNHRPANY
jgi:hypothetical protein